MRFRILKKIILTCTLCAALIISTMDGVSSKEVVTEEFVAVPISMRLHWAQPFVDKIINKYDVQDFFEQKDLNETIRVDDFVELVKRTINPEYDGELSSISRESVVYEATKIWAALTNNNLDEMPIIKMLIYSDTTDIELEYMHGVYVAWMKDIAKGKGNRIFDPKADFTYGELATLICNTDVAIEKELGEINPIMKGRYETRASYEILEDKVVFNIELMSHYTKDTTLMFGSGQSFELVITDDHGNEVYRFSDGRGFIQVIREVTIGAGESLKFQDSWDMTDKDGAKLTNGNFKAEIRVLAFSTEEDVKDVQEQFKKVIEFNLGK